MKGKMSSEVQIVRIPKEAAASISSAKFIELLESLSLASRLSKLIRSDNGPELVATAVRSWLTRRDCQAMFMAPGSPWEHSFIESFIGAFRRECLDCYFFDAGHQARKSWRQLATNTMSTDRTAC